MASLSLRRPDRPRALISLVPMVDVMLIMLVFFMVTSTYLDLDMIPAVQQQDQTESVPGATEAAATLMVRLGSDGVPVLRGQPLDAAGLAVALRQGLTDNPLAQVIVLPSGAVTTQALVSVMEAATQAGAVRLRVVRLEARP